MTPAEKVAALYRLADSTTFPEEADSARRKARELTEKYDLMPWHVETAEAKRKHRRPVTASVIYVDHIRTAQKATAKGSFHTAYDFKFRNPPPTKRRK